MAEPSTSNQDKTRGYPEETPDDKREARKPAPKPTPNPDEGGMVRDQDDNDSVD